MSNKFIKLTSGNFLNISCIENIIINLKDTVYTIDNTAIYEKELKIVTKSGNVYYENLNLLDTLLKNIDVVILESEAQ